MLTSLSFVLRYAMLIGRPPFETSTLKETYVRITSNKYYLPSHISTSARNLIQRLLSPEPSQRPSLEKILADEFFSAGYTPKTLSSSCCEWAPKYSVARILPRSALLQRVSVTSLLGSWMVTIWIYFDLRWYVRSSSAYIAFFIPNLCTKDVIFYVLFVAASNCQVK